MKKVMIAAIIAMVIIMVLGISWGKFHTTDMNMKMVIKIE